MKRYNKRQVMKDAHRLYNNDFQRRGRSVLEQLGVGNGMQSKFSKKKQQGLMQ